jgi:5-methylcytosine-specific restriction endonuclease McrA
MIELSLDQLDPEIDGFRRIDRKVMREIIRSQNGLCLICGEPIDENRHPNHNDAPSREHIWPKSISGIAGTLTANIGVTHRKCNLNRGNRLPTQEMLESHRKALRRRVYKHDLTVWDTQFPTNPAQKDEG